MAAAPVQPPDTNILEWVYAHWETAVASIFGAGLGYGATRSTIADHSRRIEKLEKDDEAITQRLEAKIDVNHAQLVGLIVDLARSTPKS